MQTADRVAGRELDAMIAEKVLGMSIEDAIALGWPPEESDELDEPEKP